MIRGIARKYFEGKTCVFCDRYGLYKLADKRVKCKHCNKYYSLQKLRTDMIVLYYFYLEISARRAAIELELNYKTEADFFGEYKVRVKYIEKPGQDEFYMPYVEASFSVV